MAHILVADDESVVLDSIRDILEDAGQIVSTACSGYEALELLNQQRYDLVVLDIVMPELSGIETCRRIRANTSLSRIPILFLTAKSRPMDIAAGLDAGGDDYLVKPYDVVELPARIRALLRRAPGGILDPEGDSLVYETLKLHLNPLKAEIGDQSIDLTPTEHSLLHYMMMHPRQPVSADQFLQDIWDYPPGVGDPQLVRVHINNLRSKLESAGCNYLQNQHGRGYFIS